MRLVVVTTSYPSHPGDPSGHFVEAEVKDLEAAGHSVVVVRPTAGGAFGWPGAAARIQARPWRAIDAGTWSFRAAAQIAAAKPDRIIANWCVPCAWPIATRAHSATPLEVVSHGGDVRLLVRLPKRITSGVVQAIAHRADRWRFVSETLLDQLSSALSTSDRTLIERVAVVTPGALGVMDVCDAVREKRDTVGDRRLYVCAGRLVHSKRIDKVIDYFADEREHHERVLVVLGDGPERPNLEKLAHRWNIDIRFLGKRPRGETLAWIGAADELVHASRAEGFSTVVREAEHLGVKVTLL